MPIGFIRNIAGTIGRYSILSIVVCACCLTSCVHVDNNVKFTLFDYGDGPFKITEIERPEDSLIISRNSSNPLYTKGEATVFTDDCRGVVEGIGSSLTESSAYVLACLPPTVRSRILLDCFGEEGANFPITRTQIGASDFCVEGRYSLAPVDGDTLLEHFSLDEDKKGFTREYYHDVIDDHYDLYHLIKEVHKIKSWQKDKTLKIVATAWTPPAWMKDINDYYNRDAKTGGKLLPQHYDTYARYLLKYVQAYNEEGIRIWAVSPANEPQGNDGNWESVHISPQEESTLIGQHIGPLFEKAGFSDVKILGFDQNTFEAGPYASAIYSDSLSYRYTTGLALHWYGSTFSAFPDVLDSLHNLYPEKALLHTEGCIDNLGCNPWEGVSNPEEFKESGWFGNDEFWWYPHATDWAFSTPFWPELHPKYAPVHRYVRYILEGMNHYTTSFIDWNVVLDSDGGPNHVNNLCGAPIMVNISTKEVYYTPVYYALRQLSRNVRPGDRILYTSQVEEYGDKVYVGTVAKKGNKGYVVNILSSLTEDAVIKVRIGEKVYPVDVKANSFKTLKIIRK